MGGGGRAPRGPSAEELEAQARAQRQAERESLISGVIQDKRRVNRRTLVNPALYIPTGEGDNPVAVGPASTGQTYTTLRI